MQQIIVNDDGLSIVNEINVIKYIIICSILYLFKMGIRVVVLLFILLKREKDISYQYFDVFLIDYLLKRIFRVLYLIFGLFQQFSGRNNFKWFNDFFMDKYISFINIEIYIFIEQLLFFVKVLGSINLFLDRLIWYVYMILEI